MKALLIQVALLLTFTLASAQVEVLTSFSHNGSEYDAVVFKINEVNLDKFDILENNQSVPNDMFIQSLSNDSLFFLINAFPFDSLCKPLGYYCTDHQVIKGVNDADGNTNFFLKPNGLFLITDQDAVICESSDLNKYTNVRLGFQAGPMLVLNGKIHPKFNQASSNQNIRVGVGIFSDSTNTKYIVFCISNAGVTFYQFAELFKNKFTCSDALCLQSAGCILYYPFRPPKKQDYNGMICSYIYYRF
jgi:uncharacterized protein YigE (DUF2233 family)